MKTTKLGHCCLIIEEAGLRIMTDPGAYSVLQNEAKGIHIILITHEHSDHLHIESLKTVLKNNPQAKIITNNGVGKLLDVEGIPYQLLVNGDSGDFGGVHFEGYGEKHEVIYENFGQVQNTGYLIASKFFYPGDAFLNPGKPIEILALPVAGPWMKLSDAINYAKAMKPKIVFPVHDAGVNLKHSALTYKLPEMILTPLGITFQVIAEGETKEL